MSSMRQEIGIIGRGILIYLCLLADGFGQLLDCNGHIDSAYSRNSLDHNSLKRCSSPALSSTPGNPHTPT